MKYTLLTNHGNRLVSESINDGKCNAFEKVAGGVAAWSTVIRCNGQDIAILAPTERDLCDFMDRRGTIYSRKRFQRVVISGDRRFPDNKPHYTEEVK